MITNEKELENYIVNDESFCDIVAELFNLSGVSVLDNQVRVGNANIVDVMCAGLTKDEDPKEKIIIVELKFHPIEAKDFAQLGRYMAAVVDVMDEDDENIYGVLLGPGISRECGCILNGEMLNDRVKVVACESKLEYVDCSKIWWRNCVDTNGPVDFCVSQRIKGGAKDEK